MIPRMIFSISIPPPLVGEGNYAFGGELIDSGGRIAEARDHLARVLADFRRVRALREPLAVEFDWQRRNMRALSHVPGLEQAAGSLQVRVVEQIPRFSDRREWHADGFQLGSELLLRMPFGYFVDSR